MGDKVVYSIFAPVAVLYVAFHTLVEAVVAYFAVEVQVLPVHSVCGRGKVVAQMM